MKSKMVKIFAVALVVFGLICAGGTSYGAQTQKKEKGPALQQLEDAAGKKIEDVKVPEVPKPTPVNTEKGSGQKK